MVNKEDQQSIDMHVKLISRRYHDDPDALMLLARKFETAALKNGYLRPPLKKHPRLVNAPRWRDTQ